jgi:hypothetical protein
MEGSTQDVDHATTGEGVGRHRLRGGVERHHRPGDGGDQAPLGLP